MTIGKGFYKMPVLVFRIVVVLQLVNGTNSYISLLITKNWNINYIILSDLKWSGIKKGK